MKRRGILMAFLTCFAAGFGKSQNLEPTTGENLVELGSAQRKTTRLSLYLTSKDTCTEFTCGFGPVEVHIDGEVFRFTADDVRRELEAYRVLE